MDVKRVLSLENKLRLADSDVNTQSKKGRVKKKKLQDDKLHNSNSRPPIKEIKPRWIKFNGHTARMEKLQNVLKILDGKPQGKIHFVYLHID
jgi:hypothetical protein